MKATAALLVGLACWCSAANADQLYKCKGAAGETIYQNEPCPNGATLVGRGSYSRQPDDPRSQNDATNMAADANAQREYERQAAAASTTYDEPGESEYARQTRERRQQVDAGSYRSRVGQRGAPKLTGWQEATKPTAPSSLNSATPIRSTSGGYAAPPAAAPGTYDPIQIRRTQQQSAEITDCSRGAGQNVTCFDSKGNASYGRTDPAGHTDVSTSDGNSTRVPDNVCIKDEYGRCK